MKTIIWSQKIKKEEILSSELKGGTPIGVVVEQDKHIIAGGSGRWGLLSDGNGLNMTHSSFEELIDCLKMEEYEAFTFPTELAAIKWLHNLEE